MEFDKIVNQVMTPVAHTMGSSDMTAVKRNTVGTKLQKNDYISFHI